MMNYKVLIDEKYLNYFKARKCYIFGAINFHYPMCKEVSHKDDIYIEFKKLVKGFFEDFDENSIYDMALSVLNDLSIIDDDKESQFINAFEDYKLNLYNDHELLSLLWWAVENSDDAFLEDTILKKGYLGLILYLLKLKNEVYESRDIIGRIGEINGFPVYLNLSKENVIVTGGKCSSLPLIAHNQVIESLFEKEDFEYYIFSDNGVCWPFGFDDNCINCYHSNCPLEKKSLCFEVNVSSLLMAVRDRMAMTDEELEKEKHIEVFFILPNKDNPLYDEYEFEFAEIVKTISKDGPRIKMGIFMSVEPSFFEKDNELPFFFVYPLEYTRVYGVFDNEKQDRRFYPRGIEPILREDENENGHNIRGQIMRNRKNVTQFYVNNHKRINEFCEE